MEKSTSQCCSASMRYIDDFLCCASCGKETQPTTTQNNTTNPTDWERDAIALILTPLIQQIFHGENSTSEQIHSEMDKALDRFVALLKTSKEAGVREGREEARKDLDKLYYSEEVANQPDVKHQAGMIEGILMCKEALTSPQEHRVDTQGV